MHSPARLRAALGSRPGRRARGDDWPQWMGPEPRQRVARGRASWSGFPPAGPRCSGGRRSPAATPAPAVAGGRVFVTDYVTDADVKVANFERKTSTGTRAGALPRRGHGQAALEARVSGHLHDRLSGRPAVHADGRRRPRLHARRRGGPLLPRRRDGSGALGPRPQEGLRHQGGALGLGEPSAGRRRPARLRGRHRRGPRGRLRQADRARRSGGRARHRSRATRPRRSSRRRACGSSCS